MKRIADSTPLNQHTDALEREGHYQALFNNHKAIQLLIDPEDGVIVESNKAASEFYGYDAETLRGMHISDINTLSPELIALEMEKARAQKRNQFLFRHRLADGTIRDVEVYSGPIELDGRSLLYSIVFDVTERRKLESTIEQEQRFLATVINSFGDGMMVINRDYTISMMNDAVSSNIDISRLADPEHPKCYEVSHQRSTPCDGLEHPCPLAQVTESRGRVNVLHRHEDIQGHAKIVEISAVPLFDEHGNVTAIVETLHDITKLRQMRESLQHQAEHDMLTGLPNRVLFSDRLHQAIKVAKRHQGKVALIFLDLDHFKAINDAMGHSIGDTLLCEVSQHLCRTIRESDTIARLGGDEFAVLIDHSRDTEALIDIVQKLMRSVQQPLEIKGHHFKPTASIGIALYPDDGVDAESLLKNADAAMYRAKSEGRNNYQFYTRDMTERAFERVVMEAQLRHALATEEFEVYYQCQFDARAEALIGMEALIRWNHPIHGIISPSRFIPLAEETGLIVEIDRWVMVTAMHQWACWYYEGAEVGTLSINLSQQRLSDESLMDDLKNALLESGCKPEWIMLEVTESQIMKHPEEAIATLRKISDLGIGVAIDDFGTGYSSLSYLKQLPINKLKIDQSFIRDLPDEESDAQITLAIIMMAKSLHLSVIAEGVETRKQRDFLLQNGCYEIQGYFYHKPEDAQAIDPSACFKLQ